MSKDHYIVTWELRNSNWEPWASKASLHTKVEDVLNSVRNMELGKEKGRVDNIMIYKFAPRTGKLTLVEPYLDGFTVKLRVVEPAEPKTQLQIQRGE